MERIVRVFKFFIWVVFLNVGNYQYAHSSETDVTETHKLISGNSLKIINKYGTSIIYFESGLPKIVCAQLRYPSQRVH